MHTHTKIISLLVDVYHLNKTETNIINLLINKQFRVEELSSALGKDRSTIQKCLYRLMKQKIVNKVSNCCDATGGRYYIYFLNPMNIIIKDVSKKIEDDYKRRKNMLEELR